MVATSSTPFGQMSREEFEQMVMQAMPMFANQGEAGDPNQLARDHVAMQANMQEGRGGTAYRPGPAQQQQQPSAGFPPPPQANAPIPQPNPNRSPIEAAIDESMQEVGTDNFTGGTPNATPSLGTGPNEVPASPQDIAAAQSGDEGPPMPQSPEEQQIFEQVQQMMQTGDNPHLPIPPEAEKDHIPQPTADQLADGSIDASSRNTMMELVGLVAAGSMGAAGLRHVANLIREGNEAAISFATNNGLDPNEFADELDRAYSRGGRSGAKPDASKVRTRVPTP